MTHKVWEILQDETGSLSFARCALCFVVLSVIPLVYFETFTTHDVSAGAWGILTVLVIGFMSWAGGTRFAQYLIPQLAATVSAVTAGIIARLRPERVAAHDFQYASASPVSPEVGAHLHPEDGMLYRPADGDF